MKQRCLPIGGGTLKKSTRVDLSSYTSSNKYTIPKVGYVHPSTISSSSATDVQIIIEDVDGNVISGGFKCDSGNIVNSWMPVFPGMKTYKQTSSNAEFWFYPLS